MLSTEAFTAIVGKLHFAEYSPCLILKTFVLMSGTGAWPETNGDTPPISIWTGGEGGGGGITVGGDPGLDPENPNTFFTLSLNRVQRLPL